MNGFHGKTVLITGGASGIGKIMGRMLLERGARLVIWDINTAALEAVALEFAPLGPVSTYTVNIADRAQVKSAYEVTKQNDGVVNLLINNAGIIVGKYFHEHTEEEITRTMDINASAPMYITRLFLKDMLEKNEGHVCTIASSAGLTSNPKMSVYVASKWAAVGWSDSLRIEMNMLKKNIGVTTVTPYYINTGMFDGVKSRIPILQPEVAAQRIIRGIEKNKAFVSMPWSVRFVRLAQGIFTVNMFDWFVGGVLGVYKTMDDFKGRK